MPIRHTTIATFPDQPDVEINAAEWNADHTAPDIADVTGLQAALNAKATEGTAVAFTSVNINGTNGSGHIHLRHQASDPSSTGQSTTVFADSNGNLAWINDGLNKATLDTDNITAARVFGVLDKSYTFADNATVLQSADFTDANISISDITTNNATASKHGFLPKLSNVATQFLNGEGNFTTPAGTAASYLSQSFSAQTSVLVTHNFGAYPLVNVIDGTGAVLVPLTITHSSVNAFTVTFASSTSGNILASLGSPQPNTFTTATGNYTTLATDYFIKCTGAASTITLVTAASNVGRIQHIINASTADINVDANGSQTINGSLTQILPPNSTMSIVSDGSNWYIF